MARERGIDMRAKLKVTSTLGVVGLLAGFLALTGAAVGAAATPQLAATPEEVTR
jgi:hypothetical protein